jgi:hypothetical protein
MPIDLQSPPEPSTTSLLAGILDDVQKLIKQQLLLTRKEVTQEIQNAAMAIGFFVAAAAVLFFGVLILGFGLVHFIHWLSTPAGVDPAKIPLWGCHALVGGPLGLLGLVFTWLGANKIRAINPLNNPAADALKENVEWATHPMK